MSGDSGKLWGGRFSRPTDAAVDAFGASIGFDRRLWRQDIEGSIAHARMLAAQGIIPETDARQIEDGLRTIAREIEAGSFVFRVDREDIHLNIEARLAEIIGPAAGRLHTGRSRNDQVATDTRLWVREAVDTLDRALAALQAVILDRAERDRDVLVPGYTHLQRAQPVLLAHWYLAYFEMFRRDRERLRDLRLRVNVSPLGSGALAGSPYPLDRHAVAEALGFEGITRNSLDAVSDRDYLVEYVAALSLVMLHLSRWSEELIVWCSSEFGFIAMDDAYATGSSMMPQKKNPDVAELIRGKSGRVFGDLQALLVMTKGLPLAYNKDLQEDKEALFDASDTTLACVRLFTGMLDSLQVQAERCLAAASDPAMLATDLADYLVVRGVPFREAHEIVGRLVAACIDSGRSFAEIGLEEYRAAHPAFDETVYEITPHRSVAARNIPGGTAPGQVAHALVEARTWLEHHP